MTVLYVENDKERRRFVLSFLAPRVGTVWVAENGDDALELFVSKRPDLVVTTLKMPGPDGITLARRIRGEDPDVPIVLTASGRETYRLSDAVEARIDAFVDEPVRVNELLRTLEAQARRLGTRHSQRNVQAKLAQHHLAVEEEALVIYIDAKGRVRRINEAMIQRLDYPLECVTGEPFGDLLYKDEDYEARYRPLFEAIAKGESWHGEVHLISRSDMELIFRATLIPIYDTERPDYQFMMLLEEITELVNYRRLLKNELDETQKTLQEKIHFLEQYQNAINEGTAICRFLEDGTILKTDARFDRIFGFDRNELIRRSFYELCPNVKARLERLIKESVRERKILRKRIRCMDKGRGYHVTDSVFIPIYRLDGEIEEIIGIHSDITDIIHLNEEIRNTQKELLYILGEVAESRSRETGHHVKRVAEYSRLLGELAGLPEEEVQLLATAAPMHDVGKIAIPDEILLKRGPLTPEEFEIMKRHTIIGGELFSHSDRPLMKAARIVALEHHENYDGSGYPYGKKGEDIHIFGRIVALADVFDALSMRRVYKDGWDIGAIVDYLRHQRNIKFDPRLTDLFLEHINFFLDIRDRIGGVTEPPGAQ